MSLEKCPTCGVDDMMCSSWRKKPEWVCVCFGCKHEWTEPDDEDWDADLPQIKTDAQGNKSRRWHAMKPRG